MVSILITHIPKYLNFSFSSALQHISILLVGFCISLHLEAQKTPTTKSLPNYNKDWKEIETLRTKGLAKYALLKTDKVYSLAKSSGNVTQIIKSTLYRINLQEGLEENGTEESIHDLEALVLESKVPEVNLYHTILGELYWKYYQRNRFQLLERTQQPGDTSNDLRLWDAKRILAKARQHYYQSLDNATMLQDLAIAGYTDILTKGNADPLFRPTLYDFLAHRAIDFFMHSDAGLTEHTDRYTMSSETLFGPLQDFIKLSLPSNDSLNMNLNALLHFQQLLDFRAKDSNTVARLDADLKRLEFVYQFSTPAGLDSLYINALRNLLTQYKVPVSRASIMYAMAKFYSDHGNKFQRLDPNKKNQYDLRIAESLANAAIKLSAKGTVAQPAKSLLYSIHRKDFQIEVENVNLPEKPFRALITYKNINEIYLGVVRVTKAELDSLNGKLRQRSSYEAAIVRLFRSKKKLQSFLQHLPDVNDYQTHATEIACQGLPLGMYLIAASTDSAFSNEANDLIFTLTQISNISYFTHHTSSDGAQEVLFLHRDSGQPLIGVHANMQITHNSGGKFNLQQMEYVSDATGKIKITPFPEVTNGLSFSLKINYGEDQLFTGLMQSWQNEYSSFTLYHGYPQIKPQVRSYLFSDRAIYRPGQPIFFKGIVVNTANEKELQVLANHPIVITLSDANHQKIDEVSLVTNDFGSYQGTFILPKGSLNGQMSIQDPYQQHYFHVEEYKRPKFELEIAAKKQTYSLGDTIIMQVKVISFSGAVVDNAKGTFRVARTAYIPWLQGWRGYSRPSLSEVQIANGFLFTDKEGTATFSFAAIPDANLDKRLNPTFYYTLYASVTDGNGETQTVEKQLPIAYTAYLLKSSIPEIFSSEKSLQIKVIALNPEGKSVPARGTIAVTKLKLPSRGYRARMWNRADVFALSEINYHKLFPYDVFDEEDRIENWPEEKQMYLADFNTESGTLNLPNVKNWEPGKYKVTLQSKDARQQLVENTEYVEVVDPGAKSVPYATQKYMHNLTFKAEPGSNAVSLLGASEKIFVYYHLMQEEKVLEEKLLEIENMTKLEVPVLEAYRGNIVQFFNYVLHNRSYTSSHAIEVPYSNKQLEVTYGTFRDKITPGSKEEWQIIVRNKKGDKTEAEILALMYDASLDKIAEHKLDFSPHTSYTSQNYWSGHNVVGISSYLVASNTTHKLKSYTPLSYDALNWFMHQRNYRLFNMQKGAARFATAMESDLPAPATTIIESALQGEQSTTDQSLKKKISSQAAESTNLIRKNFNEAAFFYPQIRTNKNAETVLSFTMPEALTRWRFMLLAHTQSLEYGVSEKEVITQKELMVTSSPPRFIREGDTIVYSAKIDNLTDKKLSVNTTLQLLDPLTFKPVDANFAHQGKLQVVEVSPKTSQAVTWLLRVPFGMQAVACRIMARNANYSDGEEVILPILTNKTLVTESLPLYTNGTSKTFSLPRLISNTSSTLTSHRLTLEYSSNPIWYAVQALPSLTEGTTGSADEIFNNYFSNKIAQHLANSYASIKAVLDGWKAGPAHVLKSNLEKNTELKNILLEETPWVTEALNETESKHKLALLFDSNRMRDEATMALNRLIELQLPTGAWPWFAGMPSNYHITQNIVAGFGQLENIGINVMGDNEKARQALTNAISFLDNEILNHYKISIKIPRDKEQNRAPFLPYAEIHYLYARSFFTDVAIPVNCKKAVEHYKYMARRDWATYNPYLKGMLALAMWRFGDKQLPVQIIASLREHAIHSEELGMYFKQEVGIFWHQAPIASQSILIEAFQEIANDSVAAAAMKMWLLKNKQTNSWHTGKATAEACYSLLIGNNQLSTSAPQAMVALGEVKVDLSKEKTEAGTGYFKKTWDAAEIKSEMGNVTVTKTGKGTSWAALYWQYFEEFDKIEAQASPLKITKQLFIKNIISQGNTLTPITDKTICKVGDLLTVRIQLKVDRDMEYMHVKDLRGAGLEPVQVLSQYQYQGGLGYYETTKDASVNFFIDYLPKGTYTFEYNLRATHEGNYSNGYTHIQCLYAPEFASHTAGTRLTIKK